MFGFIWSKEELTKEANGIAEYLESIGCIIRTDDGTLISEPFVPQYSDPYLSEFAGIECQVEIYEMDVPEGLSVGAQAVTTGKKAWYVSLFGPLDKWDLLELFWDTVLCATKTRLHCSLLDLCEKAFVPENWGDKDDFLALQRRYFSVRDFYEATLLGDEASFDGEHLRAKLPRHERILSLKYLEESGEIDGAYCHA